MLVFDQQTNRYSNYKIRNETSFYFYVIRISIAKA